MTGPPSDRVRLRRGADKGHYDPSDVHALLDAGVIAHLGVVTPTGPVVIPMAYGRDDEHVYLHGAFANAALRAADGADVCVTVTIVDGLIIARSPFHNSMQYRSAVVRGTARRVRDDAEHRRTLQLITDHVVPNWDRARPPSDVDLRATTVIAVPLTEASVKIRSGGPVDEPSDVDGPHWAGTVPISTTFAPPEHADDLPAGIPVPADVAALDSRPVHP